jgi:transcription factor WhiB
VIPPGEWVTRGRCRTEDPELWTEEHPGADGHRKCGHVTAAHQCNYHCPVRTQCFSWAMSTKDSNEDAVQAWADMVIAGFMVVGRRRQVRTRTNGYRYEVTWKLTPLPNPRRCHLCEPAAVPARAANGRKHPSAP